LLKRQDDTPKPIETSVVDDVVDWPLIHWMAVVVWFIESIFLLLCTAFAWVTLRILCHAPIWIRRNKSKPDLHKKSDQITYRSGETRKKMEKGLPSLNPSVKFRMTDNAIKGSLIY
jgi:hypothetical protein